MRLPTTVRSRSLSYVPGVHILQWGLQDPEYQLNPAEYIPGYLQIVTDLST